MSFPRVDAATIRASVVSGRRSAEHFVRESIERAVRSQSMLQAFIELTHESAADAACGIDRRIAAGVSVGRLAGVPMAIKDNICTTAGRTTCGARMLADYRSPYASTAVQRLEAAGAVVIGKTNLDEFGMGSSTENSAFHPTRNPWSLEHVPGGSSGGSAAAVAAGIVPAALGSDTGGSVRQPASFCGIVGIKPTYGRVSRYGLVAYGSSLDQIGVLAGNVTDAAAVLSAIAGHDPRDTTSSPRSSEELVDCLAEDRLKDFGSGLRIGVPRECFGDGLDAEVRASVENGLRVLERLGARLVDVRLEHMPAAIAAYYVIATAECSSNLARFDGIHYGRRSSSAGGIGELISQSRAGGLGPEVRRRILLGTYVLSAGYHELYYDKALRVRRRIQQDFEAAFQQVDLLISPTAPTTAFRFGQKMSDPLQMYLADVFTVSANLAGIPAVSVPCGLSSERLPIGLQLMGPLFAEVLVLRAARLFERELAWNEAPPGFIERAGPSDRVNR